MPTCCSQSQRRLNEGPGALKAGSNVGKRARAAFGWLASGRIATQAVQLANSIILARLLVPDDFGLLAMAMAVGGIAKAVGDFGVSAIVVQRSEVTKRFLDAAFSLNLSVFVAIGLVQVLLAPIGAYFMKEPRVALVMVSLATVLPFTGISSFFQSLLRRELSFAKLVAVNLAKVVLMAGTACVLAALGYGVWSLVLGIAVSSVFGAYLARRLVAARPHFDLSAIRGYHQEIVQFGRFATGNSLINYLVNNADYLLVGRLLSTADLGFYSFAYERSRLVNARVLDLVATVSFPAFSRLKPDRERLRQAYLKVTLGGFAITAPATIFLASNAAILIPLVFGEKWAPAVRAFQILSLHVLFNAATSGGGSVIYAVGRPDVTFRVMRWTVVPLVAAYYVGAQTAGIVGVAVAVVLVKSASSCLFIWTVYQQMNWRAWPILKPLFLVLVGALAAAAGSRTVVKHLDIVSDWLVLAVAAIAFTICYSFLECLVNRRGLNLIWLGLLGDSGAAWCQNRLPRGLRKLLAMPV